MMRLSAQTSPTRGLTAKHAKHTKLQKGLTLVELSIVLVVIALLLYAIDLTPFLKQKAEIETDRRLADIQQALVAAYRDNQFTVDANNANPPLLNLGATLGVINRELPSAAVPFTCNSNANTLAPIARFTTTSASLLFRDGFGSPMCVLISDRLQRDYLGVPLFYHTVAIVSGGNNQGVVENNPNPGGCVTGLNFQTTGNLVLCGDDRGIVIDGYQIAVDNFKITQKRIEKIVAAYEIYFTIRSTANPDPSINYFAAPPLGTPLGSPVEARWDNTSGAIPNSGPYTAPTVPPTNNCTAPADITDAIRQILGLGAQDIVDAYGNTIRYDTCSNNVRSPANAFNSLSDRQVAPFTAAIGTTLPGEAAFGYTQTAVGLVN